jgi:hypothetical protein
VLVEGSVMTGAGTDWRTELIKAHSGLFHPRAGAAETARGFPDCGDGWRDLLECACARIESALREDDSFRVVRIKDKYGALHFYWRGNVSPETEANIVHAIALAEARSLCTCGECGEEGRLYCAVGVLLTRCAVHAKGRPVKVTPSRDNIHIVRRVVAGQLSGICYRRYDRATDTFRHIPPHTLGIEVRSEISSSISEGDVHD